MLVKVLGTFFTEYEKGEGLLGLDRQKLKTQVTSPWYISASSASFKSTDWYQLFWVSICTLENGLINRKISSASNLWF